MMGAFNVLASMAIGSALAGQSVYNTAQRRRAEAVAQWHANNEFRLKLFKNPKLEEGLSYYASNKENYPEIEKRLIAYKEQYPHDLFYDSHYSYSWGAVGVLPIPDECYFKYKYDNGGKPYLVQSTVTLTKMLINTYGFIPSGDTWVSPAQGLIPTLYVPGSEYARWVDALSNPELEERLAQEVLDISRYDEFWDRLEAYKEKQELYCDRPQREAEVIGWWRVPCSRDKKKQTRPGAEFSSMTLRRYKEMYLPNVARHLMPMLLETYGYITCDKALVVAKKICFPNGVKDPADDFLKTSIIEECKGVPSLEDPPYVPTPPERPQNRPGYDAYWSKFFDDQEAVKHREPPMYLRGMAPKILTGPGSEGPDQDK